MRTVIFWLILSVVAPVSAVAQVAVNNDGTEPDNSAMLDVKSTTKGLLIPRMTMAERDLITNPAVGLMIFQIDNTSGLYYRNGADWTLVGSNAGPWQTNANDIFYSGGNVGIGTSAPVGKLEVVGGDALINGVTVGRGAIADNLNTVLGSEALYNNAADGLHNTAVGALALHLNTSGDNNSAFGCQALMNNQGLYNTGIGYAALAYNTTGNFNTAFGVSALNFNTTGIGNLAIGSMSLYNNLAGNLNIAIGENALNNNRANDRSIAIGYQSMFYADNRTSGRSTYNTAVGYSALMGGTTPADNTGQYNTAMGDNTMRNNKSGSYNTATGSTALYENLTGGYNTAIGYQAGYYQTLVSQGTFLGSNSYSTVESTVNVTTLGYNAHATASNSVTIGNSSVTSIGGYADWTNFSDGRYKTDIQENVAGLEFILKLRPVTYHLDVHRLAADLGEDSEPDENGNTRQRVLPASEIQSRNEKAALTYTGFIAQEVEQAAKSIGYDFSGVDAPKDENSFYGLRYAEFVMPLVKAVQEQQEMIGEQQKTIHNQQVQINELKVMVKKLLDER